MGTLPIDLDWEKMTSLLQRFQERRLSRDEAIELKPLLQKYYKQAVLKRDRSLEVKLNIMLIGLDGYIGMIKGRVNSHNFEYVTAGAVSGDKLQIQFDIGNPALPNHVTIYFNKEDANSFRDKVKQSLDTQIMINDDDGITPKHDIKRTGFDITPAEYHINRIIMGMTEDEKREWKIILDASNSQPSTDILFDIENANLFSNSLNNW